MPTYILYTDESNNDGTKDFFILGGVFFPVDQLTAIHSLVVACRYDNGFQPEDDFKFNTHSRPDHVSQEQHLAAKAQLLVGLAALDLRFMVVAALRDIAADPRQRWEFQGNSLLLTFDKFCAQRKSNGIVIFDRTSEGFDYAREKFKTGVKYKSGGQFDFSERLNLFAQSCIGASHIGSVVDVVLGAFRFCVNDVTGAAKGTTAMLPAVLSLMYFREFKGRPVILDYGFMLRPQHVVMAAYKAKYEELTERLNRVMVTLTGSKALYTFLQVADDMRATEAPTARTAPAPAPDP